MTIFIQFVGFFFGFILSIILGFLPGALSSKHEHFITCMVGTMDGVKTIFTIMGVGGVWFILASAILSAIHVNPPIGWVTWVIGRWENKRREHATQQYFSQPRPPQTVEKVVPVPDVTKRPSVPLVKRRPGPRPPCPPPPPRRMI